MNEKIAEINGPGFALFKIRYSIHGIDTASFGLLWLFYCKCDIYGQFETIFQSLFCLQHSDQRGLKKNWKVWQKTPMCIIKVVLRTQNK